MIFYAKSAGHSLSEEEWKKSRADIQAFIESMGDELQDWEIRVLEKAMQEPVSTMPVSSEPEKAGIGQAKTLEEHLEDTARCAAHFFEQFGRYFTVKEMQLISLACAVHDLGKANLLFQARVNPRLYEDRESVKRLRRTPQIPHGYLSAVSIDRRSVLRQCPELSKEDWCVLITAIYYHHARRDEYDSGQIEEYCKQYYIDCLKEFLRQPDWKLSIVNHNKLLFRNSLTEQNYRLEDRVRNSYLTVKGMLNKFDWTVSAGYEDAEQDSDIEEKQLKNQILKAYGNELRPAQQYLLEHKDENVVIIAPTGSGKTEAALLWLDGEKGFYTLPMKVSSNAIYQRIEERYLYNTVFLLHSDSMQMYLKEYSGQTEESAYDKYQRARLLSGPLTICTVDQLFKFVYQALGTEVFAATLKYSKLILDEIQAYSPRVVATIIYGLRIIQQMGGRFAVLTATFPPVLKYFMEKYGLVEGRQFLFRDFSEISDLKRHRVSIREEDLDIDEIIREGEQKKVLVICNTVSKAQEVYEMIAEQSDRVFLLHSRFIRQDRAFLEKRIMEFSRDPKARGIWITTQIVEASLDIDFDLLYTEMCPCDSLLQRMGRCNRAARYFPEWPNVIVSVTGTGVGKNNVYSPQLYERSLNLLRDYEGDVFSEVLKTEYMNCVYRTEEIKETEYFLEIERYLEHFDTLAPLEYDKNEVDEQFRMIKSITVVPESVYIENQKTFELCGDLFGKADISRGVKDVLRSKLEALTLSLNLFHKYPEGVDRASVLQDIQIHRANMLYEFHKESGTGRGLILKSIYEESFIF